MSHIHNPNCDGAHCKSETGEVRLLPYGGGGNMILCLDCFKHEITYRLDEIAQGRYFGTPSWRDLKVYETVA